MEKNLKTVSLLLEVGTVACFAYAGISLGKAIYYKGRLDAYKEMKGYLKDIKEIVEDKIEKSKEKKDIKYPMDKEVGENKRKRDIKYAIDKEVGELREEQEKHKENVGG